eukprot:6534859-Prymnesium_polylepis.1
MLRQREGRSFAYERQLKQMDRAEKKIKKFEKRAQTSRRSSMARRAPVARSHLLTRRASFARRSSCKREVSQKDMQVEVDWRANKSTVSERCAAFRMASCQRTCKSKSSAGSAQPPVFSQQMSRQDVEGPGRDVHMAIHSAAAAVRSADDTVAADTPALTRQDEQPNETDETTESQ